MQPSCLHLIALYTALIAGLIPAASADQDSDSTPGGGYNVEVELRHRVVIPKILYFRVGSPLAGTADQVVIDIGAAPGIPSGNNVNAGNLDVPLGNSTPIDATSPGGGELVVDIRSNTGSVNISYAVDNTLGLTGDNGKFLPFDQIETLSSDISGLPAPLLTNTGAAPGSANSVDIAPNGPFGWVVNRQATWKYRFRNTVVPIAGTYNGTVTYTASAP